MKAPAFEYARARDAAEAVAMLTSHDGFAKVVAGGQSLGPMLNLRIVKPTLLVDVRTAAGLRTVVEEPGAVVYGGAVTHADIEDGRVPDPTGGFLRRAARRIAYRAIRNRGTVGGSLAHADPAADWLTVLMTLDAQVRIQGPEGSRTEPVARFARGPFETSLADDEVLVGVRVPRPAEGARFGYQKLSVKVGEFGKAFAVVHATADGRVRACVGAIDRVPLVIEADTLAAEQDVCETALGERLPHLDAVSRRLHAAVLARALGEALGETRGRAA